MLGNDGLTARLLSTRGAYAGTWLGVLPTTSSTRAPQPLYYSVALCLRLGAPLYGLDQGGLQ